MRLSNIVYCFLFYFTFSTNFLHAQNHEQLTIWGRAMMQEPNDDLRLAAADSFALHFQREFAADKEFADSFDSLTMVSFLAPPDSTFRIATWQLYITKNKYKYLGFIQLKNGETIALNDKYYEIQNPSNKILSPSEWYGALYYNIKQYKKGKENVYVLFGYNASSVFESTKLLEVMSFKNGQIVFGAPIFDIKKSSKSTRDGGKAEITQSTKSRFILKYSSTSSLRLNYDEEMNAIIFDHLVPAPAIYKGQGITNVPDGTYESLTWKSGKFEHTLDIGNEYLDTPLLPSPILNNRKGKGIMGGKQK